MTHILRRQNQKAFTMIEIIMVVALLGFIYAAVLPGFKNATGIDDANQLNQFTGSIRTAYDYAILYQKNVRLRIHLMSGKYWLEEANGEVIRIPNDPVEVDLTTEEEKEQIEVFEADFEKYTDLAGESVPDLDDDEKTIHFKSPVISAKDRLKPTQWIKVDSSEWRGRSLGETLLFRLVQTDHHTGPVLIDDYGNEAVVSIYFSPDGRCEKTLIQIFYQLRDGVPDTDQLPYSVLVNPFNGAAELVNGSIEWDQYVNAVEEGASFDF